MVSSAGTWLLVGGVIIAAVVAVVAWMTTPRGYEDDEGFHYGDPPDIVYDDEDKDD